jgi:membrane-associated phospholipid phosphatase
MLFSEFFALLDVENLLYAIIGSLTYILFNIKGYPWPRRLEIPPGASDACYTKVVHQTVTDALQGIVIVVQALLLIPLPAVLSFWFPYFRSYRLLTAFWCYFFSLSLSGVTYSLFKGYVGRARPDALATLNGNLSQEKDTSANSAFSSFPSGHAASTMSCAVFLALFLVSSTERPTHLTTIGAFGVWLYTFLIGCSRIVDHRHHPSDVVAGWLVGSVLSIIAWTASKDQIFGETHQTIGSQLAGNLLDVVNPKLKTIGGSH